MSQRIAQDDANGSIVTQRSTGAHQSSSGQPSTLAANDNVFEGPWPLVPFPEVPNAVRSGQPESIGRLAPEGACSFFLYEEVTVPQAVQDGFGSSWTATLGRLVYVAAVSIAMFGWLYLLWQAVGALTE
jgi:hypothetical protein